MAQIAMPSLGMVMTEGTIARWLAADGAQVQKGQPVVEIETDKLTHQIEAPAAGVLKQVAAEGAVLPVEGLIAEIEEGAAQPAQASPAAETPPMAGVSAEAAPAPALADTPPGPASSATDSPPAPAAGRPAAADAPHSPVTAKLSAGPRIATAAPAAAAQPAPRPADDASGLSPVDAPPAPVAPTPAAPAVPADALPGPASAKMARVASPTSSSSAATPGAAAVAPEAGAALGTPSPYPLPEGEGLATGAARRGSDAETSAPAAAGAASAAAGAASPPAAVDQAVDAGGGAGTIGGAALSLGWPGASAPLGATPELQPGSPLAEPRSDRPVSPAARRRAQEAGIDLATVTGTGPGGRVVEADVRAAIASAAPPAAAAPPTNPEAPVATAASMPAQPAVPPPEPVAAPATVPAGDQPSPAAQKAARATAAAVGASRAPILSRARLTGMRKTIAERMTASLATGAQLTLTREVDAGALVAARQARRGSIASLPYDAFFARALATALTELPALNAAVEGDDIVTYAAVNVGIAVALEAGLVVPVVRDAASRSLGDLAAAIEDLTTRARANRLTPDDMADGTVTITNLGGHGVDTFTPILNPPQSAILGIGRIAPRPVVIGGDALAVRPTVHLSLTFDHRVADGAPAAQLLSRVASLLGDASWLAS